MAKQLKTAGAMLRFCIVCGFTWAGFLTAVMAGTFMLGRGMTGTEVGIVMVAGNGLALVAQPFISSAADRPGPLTSQSFGIGLSVATVLFMATCAFTSSDILIMVMLALIYMTAKNMPALTNSTSVYYQKRGANIDYGVARSVGAVFNSAASSIVGFWITQIGVNAIMYAGMIAFTALALAYMTMPTPKEIPALPQGEEAQATAADDADKAATPEQESSSYLDFCLNNPGYLMVVAGFALVKLMPQIVTVYGILVFQRVGAGNAEMGLAMSIASLIELPAMLIYTRLEKRFSTEGILLFAAVGATLRALFTANAVSIAMLYAAYTLAIMDGFYNPATVSYAGKSFSEADRNKAQGLMVMISPLGGIVGNLFGGFMVDSLGIGALLNVIAAGAVVGLVMVFLGVRRQAAKAAA